MGYSAYSYVGAYIELPEVETTYTKTVRRCSDESCSNHTKEDMPKDASFCVKCGKAIEELAVSVKKSKVIDYYSLGEKYGFDSELFSQVQNNRSILIPNRYFGEIESWDGDEEVLKEFNWDDAINAIKEYTKNAQVFIDKVKEVYGIELQVKFGVVSYTM